MLRAMTLEIGLTLTILTATVLVLASRRLRADLTALCATLALILTGVLTPQEAFSAFGQPVIIIIPSIFVLGAALYQSGVATLLANRLVGISDRGPAVLVLVITLVGGLLSGVLGSLLVLVVLMPAVLRIARRARLAPALLLLPLVAGVSAGNLLTLIGTVSNVVVGDLLVVGGHEPLGFFSLMPFGLVSLLAVVLWYTLIGRRLLRQELPPEPEQPSLGEVEQVYRLQKLLHRLRVRSVSNVIGLHLVKTDLSVAFGLNVLAVQPRDGALQPARPDWVLEQDDVLVVEGGRGDVAQVASLHSLEHKGTMPLEEFNQLEQETLRLAELMIPFRSQLVGKTLAQARFRERYGLNILAVHRQGRAIREDLADLKLIAGDTLLAQGPLAYLRHVGKDHNLVVVTHLGPQPGDLITSKAKVTLGILAVMVVCVVSGLLSLATASLAAAVALILTGCISLERAYRSIDGHVLVLVGAMLPLAMALEKTGAAELLAGQLTGLSARLGSLGTLLLLYLFASFLTQVVSNAATAALVTPIAINLAIAQGLAPQPFAMAMAVAVTASYVTPLTNTEALLVREPGRYTMQDYLRNGLPIYVLQTVGVMVLIAALYL
jgi:di/tricarboxylate transporter